MAYHITISQRGECDDGIPKRRWNRGEPRVLDLLLRIVHNRCENDDCHRQREHEEP